MKDFNLRTLAKLGCSPSSPMPTVWLQSEVQKASTGLLVFSNPFGLLGSIRENFVYSVVIFRLSFKDGFRFKIWGKNCVFCDINLWVNDGVRVRVKVVTIL